MNFRPTLFFTFFFTAFFATAQVQDTSYQAVSVVAPAVYYLDSRLISQVSGHSRMTVLVKLPPNTVKWYYTFAATGNKSDVPEWVGLVGQLTRYVDKSGIAAYVIGQVSKPIGTAICDVHILDTASVKPFEAKTDDKWASDPAVSKVNLTSGIVEVPFSGKSALAVGLLNPSLNNACNVKIEISAVVRVITTRYNVLRKAGDNNSDATAQWSSGAKDTLIQTFQGLFLGKTSAAVTEVANAMMRKITHDFTPAEYANLAKAEAALLHQSLRHDCLVATRHTDLEQTESRAQQLLASANNAEPTIAVKQYREIVSLGYPSETVYNGLAKALICQQQYDEASKTLELSQKVKADQLQVALLQAHILLLTNNYNKAENQYTRYRGKKINDSQTWEQAVADDFNLFVKNKVFSSQYDNIRKKLKIN